MNILHMKYAVEVARMGSVSKASEKLYIAQPNLSRSIRELEAELGTVIFDRSAKGMILTQEGEQFISYANAILNQIDSLEQMFKNNLPVRRRFSVSVPRATYISEAFVRFSRKISADPAELFYKETNSSRTIKNLLSDEYKLGIVRYAQDYDKQFKAMFEEKGFVYEVVSEFRYLLAMQKDSPLAALPEIHFSDLEPYIEIAHADPYVPSLSAAQVRKEELPDTVNRRIFVFERASQFDLLAENAQTFMWVSPLSTKTMKRFGLVQRECADNQRVYRDVLIYKKDYKLTEADRQFISEVCLSRQENL